MVREDLFHLILYENTFARFPLKKCFKSFKIGKNIYRHFSKTCKHILKKNASIRAKKWMHQKASKYHKEMPQSDFNQKTPAQFENKASDVCKV